MEVYLRAPMEEQDEELFSECSSGCESGWTVYLDESLGGPWGHEVDAVCSKRRRREDDDEDDEEDDEDGMSTVSDASSGPPTLHGTDASCCSCSLCCCCGSCPHASSSSGHDRRSLAGKQGEREREQQRKRTKMDDQQDQHLLRCWQSYQDLLEDTATSPILPSYYAQLDHVTKPLSNTPVIPKDANSR